ncbi:MAG: signal peptidase I, partial [Paludibacteraceae bacterium]|nr:signal peptidase I [Paludibacteraceae bacterium]
YINGEKIDDPYPSTPTDNFSIEDIGHKKVPGDTYFVMGDNRSDSLDSRYASVGVINKSQILGRARFISF